MRALATSLAGLAVAVLVVGAALVVLLQPPVTQALVTRFGLAEEAGLPRGRMLEVAEQVRAFVAGDSRVTLPAVVDGRPGFDAAAVSHLADVRTVIRSARTLTIWLAVAAALALALAIVRGRADLIAATMRAAGAWCVGLMVLAVAAGTLDFERLFSAFHAVFFAAGTWQFPSDSLLIQTFPEQFWATAAGLWAGIVVLGAVALVVLAGLVRQEAERRRANQ